MATAQDYLTQKKKEVIDNIKSMDPCAVSFIGIDRSLTSTGFAVVCDGRLRFQTEIKTALFGADRLIEIGRQCLQKISQWGSPFIVMEGYSFNSKFSQGHSLGELGGVLKAFFTMKKISWMEVEPTTLKKYITGKGSADKALVPMFINKRFGSVPQGNDEADAIGCAFFGYHAFHWLQSQDGYKENDVACFNTFFSLVPKKKQPSKRKRNQQMALEINE